MTLDWRESTFHSVLTMIENGPPKDLLSRAQPEASDRGATLTAADLQEVLQEATAESGFLNALGMQVHKWDVASKVADWVDGTLPSTSERRDLVAAKLGFDAQGAKTLLDWRPIFTDGTVVVTGPWNRWYTPERAKEHQFYWPLYKSYLLDVRQWENDNVTSLDLATSDVVDRLADPTAEKAYQSKGLVVGYVQSGKTANFTGVIAKAIDAGYRLIIVMTGTIEMLRAQTQRRIDMEMVGRQNIQGDFTEVQAWEANVDYQDEDDWPSRFIDLGESELVTEIRRLTQHHKDYQKQFKTLKIDRVEMSRALWDGLNLFKAAARLAVVKKNAMVLKKLVTDIELNRKAFEEIPVLIIDDESDQASIDTIDPQKARKKPPADKVGPDGTVQLPPRRAVNGHIARMLELMPRAQYVGYTATPFANVFVDPSDPVGIFPKDFVIGLRRPPGYMGVEDFHDLHMPADAPRTFATSNEAAYVRSLNALETDKTQQDLETATAIDMFVLTGALKLYRRSVDPTLCSSLRHHTMLVHESMKQDSHREAAARIDRLWNDAQFSDPTGKARMRDLYERDLLPVSQARLESSIPPAPDFDTLSPFIPKAIVKIAPNDPPDPVIVVNSDQEVQAEQTRLDFGWNEVWKILVGGAKLSRGFTVEGLTVTYFRRATNLGDSLTQMGRWFGFRHGYQDLVRLYIARHAKFQRGTVDLYEAFESVAIDEAAFRRQLEKYAEWDGDKPKLLPSQIPPLVTQHLPWLRPTARAKMFNSRLVQQSEQPFNPVGYPNDLEALSRNLAKWQPVLGTATTKVQLPGQHGQFDAYIGVVPADTLIEVIEMSEYLDLYRVRSILPKTTFYRDLLAKGSLSDFLVVMPQPQTGRTFSIDGAARSVADRDRRPGRGGLFGEITTPDHRWPIEGFVGHPVRDIAGLKQFANPGRGAVLVYLVHEKKPSYENAAPKPATGGASPGAGLVVAFSAYVPHAALPDSDVLVFQVIDEKKETTPSIDAPTGAA